MAQEVHEASKKSFKETLNLPRTEFPMRPNHAADDPALLDRWQQENIYRATFEHNQGKTKYILHDGPPYANGAIHIGHAYNKILKDILTKAYRMLGYHVPVTPGWDCHGLPIELKVTQENPHLGRAELQQACRKYAQHWIDIQKQSFKNLGVFMDWDLPYVTMDPAYEATIIRAFGILVQKNFIERKNKTVPWCPQCKTVLATAEIEYETRKDPSIYVLFELVQADTKRLFPELKSPVYILVWTTTPWTLPLNRAVLAKPQAEYMLVESNGLNILIGAHVADKLAEFIEGKIKVIKKFSAQYLAHSYVRHPFLDRVAPILFDESVGIDEGTAFVHCAPGCGPLDYEVGVKNNLEIYSPISADGKYSAAIEPTELEGMPVAEGQIWVIKKLAELQKLFFKTTITHSYPYCWRSHSPLIFRATPQWFFDLNKEHVKEHALKAIGAMKFIPEHGRNFLKATLENRWEWCLSRQRVWGAPIPALLCTVCDYAYLTPELISLVADGVEREGVEFWDTVAIADLVKPGMHCKQCNNTSFKKEFDILDVWFDSGISHYAVLYHNPLLSFPADMYLEGVDQHRGWFQSSLLTSMVLEEIPCTKAIMTHGYTVDAKGRKMSKSLGNVVEPETIIKQLGTDGLRLWVASIGHTSDPVISDILLQNVGEVYRKIRNTCRFLLSNLYDFDSSRDKIPHEKLFPIDRYAITQLYLLNNEIIEAYEKADFTHVFHQLADYCASELSAFYLDIIKDRLYVEKADGHERRSAQTVVWYLLDTLTRLIAPIASFTAEHLSDYYQKDKTTSIHLQNFSSTELLKAQIPEVSLPEFIVQWNILKDVRSALLKSLEIEREKGLIKHSLEAQVTVYLDLKEKKLNNLALLFTQFEHHGYTLEQFFKEFLIVSQLNFAQSSQGLHTTIMPGVYATVSHAAGVKCPRCWQWDITNNPDGLCNRCQRVLGLAT